ncbi:MAG: amino acid ABC transporter ATP-binding protein [Clostridiales bacterium]|nr:amino acid ABC transporter ATP-binding protein [Clostridiales bacterium]
MLEIKNLHKSFGQNEVLKGVSFSMDKGEVMSVIGSSGSGKTTLLRCLTFLETANAGEIYVDGQLLFNAADSKKLSDREIREKRLNFGLVFQDFNLFPQYSVLGNIVLAPKLLARERPDYKKNKKKIFAEIEERAYQLLEKVGLSEKAKAYPCELSGGQKQRVSIARALCLDPKILFFDEPTSALDPELTGEILRVIKNLSKENMTMIIVTHEMNFARDVSDKIMFMDAGVIADYGTPEQVLINPQKERTREFLQSYEK